MELNNGTSSGVRNVNLNTQSLLSTMLSTLQNANNIGDVENQLKLVDPDFSLIVSTTDRNSALSFEYSTNPALGMNFYYAVANNPMAVTNYFVDPVWGNRIPKPTDATTWYGVTRRNNLLNLASSTSSFNIPKFQDLMNKNIKQGGAVWDFTIYQLIVDSSSMDLYVRLLSDPNRWYKIPLNNMFK